MTAKRMKEKKTVPLAERMRAYIAEQIIAHRTAVKETGTALRLNVANAISATRPAVSDDWPPCHENARYFDLQLARMALLEIIADEFDHLTREAEESQ